MILSGREIVKHIGKEIIIEPFDPKRVNPNSYNLSLANELLVYDEHVLDMKKPNTAHRIEIPEDGLLLEPNRLYLGRTKRIHQNRPLYPHAGGAFLDRTARSVHPCDGGFRRRGLCGLLDA